MKFIANPYYSPEKCDLEIFKSIDTGDSYEFDMLVIWRKLDDNTLWWDTDSGCSCPVPFDPDDDRHNLKQITSDTLFNFKQALTNHYNITEKEVRSVMSSVKNHLNKSA